MGDWKRSDDDFGDDYGYDDQDYYGGGTPTNKPASGAPVRADNPFGSDTNNPFDDPPERGGTEAEPENTPDNPFDSTYPGEEDRFPGEESDGHNSGAPDRPPPPPRRRLGRVAPPDKVACACKMCGCCGIPVYIHWIFPVILLIDIATVVRIQEGTVLWIIFFICYDIALFFHILVHEYGHCAATYLLGGTVSHILLWPLGGLAYIGDIASPAKQSLIALAGPLTHIPWAILYGFLLSLTVGFRGLFVWRIPIATFFAQNFLQAMLEMQILLFCFNLLVPAWPLDGGRVLASTMLSCGASAKCVAYTMLATSVPVGVFLIIVGIWNMMPSMTVFVGAWVLFQALMIWRRIGAGTLHKHPLFGLARENDAETGTPMTVMGDSARPEDHI